MTWAYSRKTIEIAGALEKRSARKDRERACEGHKKVERDTEHTDWRETHRERTGPPSGGMSEVGAVLLSADPRTSRRSGGVHPSHVVQCA